MYSVGDRVVTPHGNGVVTIREGIDRTLRFAVRLEISPFGFNPVYYWPHELRNRKVRRKRPDFYCRSFEEGPKTCLKKTQCDFCFMEAMNSNPKKAI